MLFRSPIDRRGRYSGLRGYLWHREFVTAGFGAELPHRLMYGALDPGTAPSGADPFFDDHAFAPCNLAMPKRAFFLTQISCFKGRPCLYR